MSAATVIKWSDTGAPTLNNTAGSLINVLDFCLPSRGWVKEFSGTGKAVYRAGSGNRKYYRVLDDLSMASSGFYSALVTGYDSMTDVDTGAGWGQSAYIRTSYNDTSAKRWICVVDEKGFFITTQPSGGTGVDIALRVFIPQYIGETVPALAGQTARDVIAACTLLSAYNSCIATPEYNNSATKILCNRSLSGGNTSLSLYIENTPIYTGASSGYPAGNFLNAKYNYPHNGELLYGKAYLPDYDANTIGDYIPWLYYTAQKGQDFINGGSVSADGKTLLSVYTSSPTTTALNSVVTTGTQLFGALLIAINEER